MNSFRTQSNVKVRLDFSGSVEISETFAPHEAPRKLSAPERPKGNVTMSGDGNALIDQIDNPRTEEW